MSISNPKVVISCDWDGCEETVDVELEWRESREYHFSQPRYTLHKEDIRMVLLRTIPDWEVNAFSFTSDSTCHCPEHRVAHKLEEAKRKLKDAQAEVERLSRLFP